MSARLLSICLLPLTLTGYLVLAVVMLPGILLAKRRAKRVS